MTEELRLSHFAKLRMMSAEKKTRALLDLKTRYDVGGSDDDIFVWDAEISNDLLDSHFTHMSEGTLANYAQDAEAGVAFLRGHNWSELPVGYSFASGLDSGSGKKSVVSSFYTTRGIPDADDLIARIKSGLVRDVSVGFHGGTMRCDLCGQDFWECRHYPGIKYEEKVGDTVTTALATFTIEDARLSEVSGVFDGSTPEAMILKAQRAAKAGRLTQKEAVTLEGVYRTRLALTTSFVVPEIPKESVMEEKDVTELRSILGATDEASILVNARDMQEKYNLAVKRVSDLEPLAAEGTEYRNDLVTQALAEGVRAQGNDFDAAVYEPTLRSVPIATVKRMRDDWKKLADSALPAGRQTTEGTATNPIKTQSLVPDSAYS